jgi:hypothetical protein
VEAKTRETLLLPCCWEAQVLEPELDVICVSWTRCHLCQLLCWTNLCVLNSMCVYVPLELMYWTTCVWWTEWHVCLFSTEWHMCVCAELDGICVFVFNWMGSSVKFYRAHWLHIQKDWIQETKTLDNNIRIWPFIWYMVLSSYIGQSSYMVLSIMLCIKLIHNPTTPHSLTWSMDHTGHHYN